MGVGVDGLVLGLARVHERLDQPVRALDLEAGAADGELPAVGRMKDEAVAPADPEIELVDHSPRWRGSTSGQMLGLGVEPEDQLRWRLHDVPERSHLLIGRCWGAGQSIVRSGRPAKPSIETDISRISLRPLMTPPGSAGA